MKLKVMDALSPAHSAFKPGDWSCGSLSVLKSLTSLVNAKVLAVRGLAL